jgi:predicted DNA-binding protein with PD1-like motif
MAFYTGRTGSLAVNGTQVAKIRDWSIETTVELLSTNTIESTSNTFVPGVKGATGSATLMYYRTEASDVGKTQFTTLLNKIQKTGAIETSDRVEIELNVGTDSKDDIKFNAYITSATVSTSTGELAVVPINFTVDGDFTDYVRA